MLQRPTLEGNVMLRWGPVPCGKLRQGPTPHRKRYVAAPHTRRKRYVAVGSDTPQETLCCSAPPSKETLCCGRARYPAGNVMLQQGPPVPCKKRYLQLAASEDNVLVERPL